MTMALTKKRVLHLPYRVPIRDTLTRGFLAGLLFGAMGGAAEAQDSRFRPLPGQKEAATAPTAGGIAGLPYARGRRFATLHAYLAFRREQGAIDLPWYEEVAPGVYELRTSVRPALPPRRITREALARRYGFAR
jgi:hypothetical protein